MTKTIGYKYTGFQISAQNIGCRIISTAFFVPYMRLKIGTAGILSAPLRFGQWIYLNVQHFKPGSNQ
jgi:hypothetical protein